MKGQIKKIISVILIVAMTITNNGLMVLADSVGNVVDHTTSVVHETPNYYYEQTTTVESYQEYLKSQNPDVFDENETESSDYVEEPEDDNTTSSKDFDAEENETTEREEDETTTTAHIESENTTTESSETTSEEETTKEETTSEEKNETTESKKIVEETATLSDAEESTTKVEEEKPATVSEADQDFENEKKENVATESEVKTERVLVEEKTATESELSEVIATESELNEVVSTTSQIAEAKEIIIATVSKVSWKVKKVLIATFASLNVQAKETEKDHMARLATYANVIIVNDKGKEKVFKVNLKWQLLKKYDVNAKSDKQSAPISKDVWRKSLKVDEFINSQEEAIISTSNIAAVEERVKEENAKHEDKEFVIKLQSETQETTVSPAVEESKVKETSETPIEDIKNIVIETTENETYDKETYDETVETTLEETIKKIIEETTDEIEIIEPTVAGFNNTEEEGKEETATESETNMINSGVAEEKADAKKEKEQIESVDTLNANGEEIPDYTLGYYDLLGIYLYKIDVQSLGDEIIELIDKANKGELDENKIEELKKLEKTEENNEGILEGLLKFLGLAPTSRDAELGSSDDTGNKSDDGESLKQYLVNAKVDVLESTKFETIVAEIDEHDLGDGATHTQHVISSFVNGEKIDADNMFDSRIGGDATDMLDLSSNNKRIKATGSNIFIAGTYYLPSDIKISNNWIIESENTLTLCLNGHNITFATAGCVRGQGRVVVCNCGGDAKITTDGPTYNWHDKWYASTSETYTKWNERALFSGKEVGIYAKNNNILFENAVIKNQYNGRKSLSQMEDTEMDEAEYSGDGSLVWGKNELQVYGVKFNNNKATRSNGVAANAQLGKMILEDCSFVGNQNLSNRGGAVAFNPKATIIYNCVFENNTSFTNGGALYGRSYTNSRESVEIGTVIEKTTFKGNSALIDGGAIYMDYLCEKGVTIKGTETDKVVFQNNFAGVAGGAIAVKHMRSVDGQDVHAYSYEDPTSRGRLLNISYATFEGNAAKGIRINRDTGVVTEDDSATKENFGGAIYLSAQTVKYNTFPTDTPVKTVNIDNCSFDSNFTKGYPVEIRAKDSSGSFTGDLLAKYNVGNYGGAIYANKINSLNINGTTFNGNQSITGGGLCVKESTVSVIGGELSNGKAYNSTYAATEFYKKIVSPGGGAVYVMKDAHIAISNDTKIESNENAFYLDGGSIDLGSKDVKSNIGEYLIGYTNYKTNRILFSGVDIKDHEFNEVRKDYASTLSDATTGSRSYEYGIYAPSYISFKNTNSISGNKRNFYTKTGTTYTSRTEKANLVMTSSASNLKMDLSKYLFDVPFTEQDVSERIGLYYDFDPNGDDQLIAFDKWTHENVRVIDEGGLWTNYFEIDNSGNGEWASGWKFYIERNLIRMSPNIVQVKFDSYIENVPRIKPQYYNFRKSGNQKIKIATPTEIVRRDIFTPGKTLLGFLGVDKTDPTNTKYDIWDFDRCVIDPSTAVNNEIVIILLYTDDTIQIKPCGCKNGEVCVHDGTTSTHADRGTGTTEETARYLNYIEVATYPQLSYRYKGRKTQYALSKDLTLTADQAKEFIDGGIVLNLNGKTLTYDTSDSNDSYIFSTTGTDVMQQSTDAKVMICGIASPAAAKRGKIVAGGNHKGAFIIGNSDIYLSNLDVENITATSDSDKAFVEGENNALDTYVYTKDVSFDNINLKSDLINAGSRVVLKNTKVTSTSLHGSIVKLQANSNVNTSLDLLSSEISGLTGVDSLLSANLVDPKAGTKVNIATSNIVNNIFENNMLNLSDSTTGENSSIRLQGNVNVTNNTVNTGSALIYNSATNGDDIFGTSANDIINISNNTVPHSDDATVIGFYQKSVTLEGKVLFNGNKAAGVTKATNKVATIRSGNNTIVYFNEIVLRVTGNNTLYEWYAENIVGSTQTFDKPIFTQIPGTKLRASDSEIKIRLKENSEDQGQKIYENWSINNIIGEKEAEATFMRDGSYAEDDPFDIYKKGKNDVNSDIYLGSSFVAVRFRLYNYKANVDERLDPSVGYTQAAIQRVEPDVYTLLDTPQYHFDFSRTSVMWEAFAYRNSDNTYDYSKERLYPEKTTNIAVKATRSVLVSGYIYNYNNKRHVHEGNIELWTEARNEGHLQATNSYVFLHNDIEITHPLLFTPETTYHLCLNGHKLKINTSLEWFNSSTCKLIICDCQKTGSIVQENGEITSNVINVRGGELDINNVTFGPFSNIKDTAFIRVNRTVKTNISDVVVSGINMNNTALADNSFIDIETNNLASISNISFKSNKMLSNSYDNAILSIDNLLGGSITMSGLSIENNEINGSAVDNFNGSGYVVKLDGYENVTLEAPVVKSNKSVLGSPIRITGNASVTSMLNMNDVTFTDNQKIYLGTMDFSEQVSNGISANFATTNFRRFNITGGTFKGNRFNANGSVLQGTEGAATELINYESILTVKNVTFDGTGVTMGDGNYGIVIVDNEDDLFEDVTVTNYNIGEEIFMILGKSSGLGPAVAYSGRTTFRGNTQFIDNRAFMLVCNENYRTDSTNVNEGLVLFNGTKFTNNTVNKKQGRNAQGLFVTNGTAITIASGAIVTKTAGTAVNVATEETRLFNTEISGGSGDDAAVYVSSTGKLTIGDKVVVKGNKTNIYIDDNGITHGYIQAIAGHPILSTTDISISAPDVELNFFDEWGPSYIEKYNYHSGSTYAYLPGDLFKLDAAMSNRHVYIDGDMASGDQKLWISSTQAISEYATLIFFDKDIQGPKEITRQYIKIGQVTKLDRVQVDYISTLSQVWMTESDGSRPEEEEMWRLYSGGHYNDFEVRNYEAGKTYYAYLFKKHIHKICGPDSLIPCGPNHADGVSHTIDYEFIQVGNNDNIIVEASRSNYIGLSNNLTVTQAALDSLVDRDIVFCLNGYNLTFEKDAHITTTHNFTFVNCEHTGGAISVEGDEMTTNSLVNVSGTGKTFSLYNINFQDFGIESSIVRVQDVKVVSENVSFKNIKTTAANGMYDIVSGTVYVENLLFTNNIASGSSLLDLRFNNFTVGKIGSIQINNNTYTNKLLSLSGAGNMDSIVVENNIMIEGGGSDSYGAIYVANGASITYVNDAKISSNDASINEESKGGALSVYGTLNFNGNVTLENNKAGLGGAIYVDNTGSLNVSGEAYFKQNEGKIGGAIYAKRWNNIHMASAIYDENVASTHGVVAFGGAYSGVATFKNHTRSTKELIYNVNDNGSDSIVLDRNTLFYDNALAESIVYLRNVSSADIGISYLSTGNSVKSFVELATGSITLDNAVVTDNTFTDSVFIIDNPSTARVASISVYENKITNAILSVSGGVVEISNDMTFRDNIARLGNTKELYVSGKDGYFRATERISMGKKYLFSAYTNGVKVFEKWNATLIENYDNPQNSDPGHFMVTPENSDTIKLSEDDIAKGYGFYKVGSTNNQDIYIGKEGVDFIQLRFIDPENGDALFASQNIERGKETKLDKVDTLECDLVKQKWIATMSDGTARTFVFTTTQTASSSDTINILYTRPHLHKICGLNASSNCNHMNGTNHTTQVEYQIVANAAEFATTTDQYVYIKSDIEVSSAITLSSSIKGICLNGYTMKIVGGTDSLFNVANELSICNCKVSGGITTGDQVQTAPVINFTGTTTTLSVYNIDFFGINTDKSVINIANDGNTLYTGNLTFRDNKDLGYDSIINTNINYNSNNIVYLDNVKFEDNKNDSEHHMVDVYSGYHISTLSFINNDLETRLAWFRNRNLVDVGSLIVKNNDIKYDVMAVYFDYESKLAVSGDILFENNTIDEDEILMVDDDVELNVSGSLSFINNTAKKHAAMNIGEDSTILAGNILFDGNKNTEPNNAIVNWSEARLVFNDVVFKNHPNATDILLANEDNNGTSEIYLTNPTFINNKGIAVKLDGVANGTIDGLKLDSSLNNNFTNVININNSTVSITDLSIDGVSLANSAVVINDSTGVKLENVNVRNNTITTSGAAALSVNGNSSIINVKGLMYVDGNTNNIVLSDGSYLKANGIVSKDSVMNFNISGTSQKLFEGWDKNHIESYGRIASKSNPRRYTYTPENSGLFSIKPTSGYAIYKGGTGNNVSVYAGTSAAYSVLSFVYKDEDGVETIIDTQNVIKGTTAINTHLDTVDSYEYELEHQIWYAPNAAGEYNIKWEFKNDVISNLNSDSQIKYVRKHIHKVCGAKFYDECNHKETTQNHNRTVVYEDATNSNIAPTTEYINLLNDMEFTGPLSTGNLKGICLNGHKIIIGNLGTNFMSLYSTLHICDCKKDKVDTAAITVKDNVTLKNSIIRVNSSGTLNAYGIRFENLSLQDESDEISTTYTYAIENYNNGHVYLENPIFTGPTTTGANGLLRNNGSANQFIVVEPLFTEVTLNSPSPLLSLNRNFAITTISVIKNDGYSVPLIKVIDDVSVGCFVLKDNTGATGQGLVSIDEGRTLTLTKNNIFEGNESQGGGVIRVEGTLVAEKDLIFKNNITVRGNGNGGALYVDEHGKVVTHGRTEFIGNEAMFGAAIFANNISEDALKDMKEPYFEDNTVLTRGVIYWSGTLKLTKPTIVNHKPYDITASTGVRTGIIVNKSAGDRLILEDPIFKDNNLVGSNDSSSAIKLTGVAAGSEIRGLSNNIKNNTMANLVYAEDSNLTIEGYIDSSSSNNKFSDTILNIRNAANVTFDDLCLEDQIVDNAAVYISGAPVKLINEVRIISNETSRGANAKNVVLADDNAYFEGTGIVGAPAFIDHSSIIGVSVNGRDAVKIFEGWNAENFEYYDKPQVDDSQYRYVYAPENAQIFVLDEAASNQALYKKGYAGDGDGEGNVYLGTKDNYVTLKYYNDVEEVYDYIDKVGDKEYYCYQNIAKGVPTKLDKVDSHEYEIEKQEWYIGYQSKDTYDYLEKFNPANPQPTVAGVNGVVETFDTDQEIKYHQFHIHKVCGLKLSEECDHHGHADHTSTVNFNDVNTIDELEAATGYAVLVKDLDVANMQRSLTLNSGLKGICLNGHSIMGDGRYGLFNIDHEFTLCNCKPTKENSGITSDESFTQARDIININTTEEVGIYRITIRDVAFGAGCAVNVEQGNVFIGSLSLNGCTKAGTNGVIRSNVNIIIDNLEFYNNKLTGTNPMLRTSDTLNINKLYILENEMEDSIVSVNSDTTIGIIISQVNTSANKGAIYVAAGKTLTVGGQIIEQNTAKLGGALYLAGTYKCIEDDPSFYKNSATEKGGAIYIADGGKLQLEERALFTVNEAPEGAAIYAENLRAGDIVMPKSEFWANTATNGATITFGGELELSNIEFMFSGVGVAGINNINTSSATDKAIISSVSVISNVGGGKVIALTNVKDGSRVQNIIAEDNEIESLVEFNDIANGNRVYVTNVKVTNANKFSNAAIAFNNVPDAVLNNVVIDGNSSTGYGALLVNGADTKVYSVGELTINNNTNTGTYGAAITIIDGANLEEDGGMTISGNRSSQGGAIYLDGTMGVEAQGSKPLKVSTNYINNTSQTKNIFVVNENSYVYATGRINDDTQLGFTAGTTNVTAFKYWNSTYISKIGSTDKFAYTPENCGLFLVDTLSQNAKQEFFKSGTGNDVAVKLGANFTKLRFVTAGKTTEYVTQNIERGVDTKLDKVQVESASEKWIAPNSSAAADFKWQFNRGDVVANYSSAEEFIYKLFTYTIVYTGGSKGGSQTYNNIEYGEAIYAIDNPFEGLGFKSWTLRTALPGIPREYAPGDLIKNVCVTDGGTAYLDARWSGEIIIKFDPNGSRFGLDIPYDSSYDIYIKANKMTTLKVSYPLSLAGGRYIDYNYNLSPDGTGQTYGPGQMASFNDDVTLYLMWIKPSSDKGGGGTGGGGGSSGGGRSSGGTIHSGVNGETGPGIGIENQVTQVGAYTIDSYGNIRDASQNIVGNIYIGDRVNADGSFTASNGITIYPNGAVVDTFGNIYNPDGSITTANGTTYFVNGDVMDATGTIYHADGSTTLPNGTVRDADGIVHYPDGSIMLPDGTKYLIDGTMVSPGGIRINPLGEIVQPENAAGLDTPGAWNYDPSSNKWKFEHVKSDGTKVTYTDQWVSTKNAQGQSTWYTVDSEGNMITGWLKSDGEYYFMSTDPNTRGELVKGTVLIDGKSYTFDQETGALKSGDIPNKNISVLGAINHISGVDGIWLRYSTGEKYFVKFFDMPDGSRLEVPPSEWFMIDGNYYYFDKYGIPQTGLIIFDGKYYFFNSDGTMKEGGEVTIGDTIYVLDKATGACRTMRQRI